MKIIWSIKLIVLMIFYHSSTLVIGQDIINGNRMNEIRYDLSQVQLWGDLAKNFEPSLSFKDTLEQSKAEKIILGQIGLYHLPSQNQNVYLFYRYSFNNDLMNAELGWSVSDFSSITLKLVTPYRFKELLENKKSYARN